MMRQYREIKEAHRDAILFFRLGDFYEMFYEDAIEASRLLDITLTTRNKNSPDPVPLCGVPYHAAESYIARLTAGGKKVAICDQVEDPKEAKGIVRREITRVVSPGVVLHAQGLKARAHNFIFAFVGGASGGVCAVSDVSTGLFEFWPISDFSQLNSDVARLKVKEVILAEGEGTVAVMGQIKENFPGLYVHTVNFLYADADFAADLLREHFGVLDATSLGLTDQKELGAVGLILGYLKEIKVLQKDLLGQPRRKTTSSCLILDEGTVRSLELFKTRDDENSQGTLLGHLDRCATAFGARALASLIAEPLLDKTEIEQRLSAVEELVRDTPRREAVCDALKRVADLERLANRFVTGSAHARDVVSLRDSLAAIPAVLQALQLAQTELLKNICGRVGDFSALQKRLEDKVVDDPPLGVREGGIIREGVNPELDELRVLETNGKVIIAQMEAKEREKTGINSLKVRYNSVFGYYIEVTHTHSAKVPPHYVRKQTLTNAERYITDELKQHEAKVLGASERSRQLEYDIFCGVREEVKDFAARLKETASVLALVDVLQSLAATALAHNYVKPLIVEGAVLDLKGARHPILEALPNSPVSFVPNDISLNVHEQSLMIITGPNMAGKSTVMRQVALIVIMAQMGSFVPCSQATVGLSDRIFTRVGAHDALQKGHSTFMVEMVDVSKILREATPKSLILLDEIGRGTSTFDGLSIAWAVAEDLHDRIGARTLFATHYHELCDLAASKPRIRNHHMAVKEANGEVIFLHKLRPEGTNRSLGVAVARMAGLPSHTVDRAKEVLYLLEKKDLSFQTDISENARNHGTETRQLSLFASRLVGK